jgi:carboxyl-terminal processing protease
MILTSLLLTFMAPLQEPAAPSLEALVAEAEGLDAAAVLRLADASGIDLGTESLTALPETLAGADSFSGLLLLGRLSAFGEDPSGIERLVELLEPAPASEGWGMAALATLRLPAFRDLEAPTSALALWLSEQVPDDDPRLWAEGQFTLHRIGDSTARRAALRNLRGSLRSPAEGVAAAAVLALGRAGVPLGDDELLILEDLASGIGADAGLAQALLDAADRRAREQEKIAALQRLYAQPRSGESAIQAEESLDVLDEVLQRIKMQHMEGRRFSEEELAGAAADGMLRRLDPHSTFFTGEEFGEFMFDMTQAYGGIGAYVNTVDNVFTIIRPIYSGPAYEAGMLSGDKVLEVDGWSTAEQPNDEIIKRLKGEPGTEVKLLVFRNGWTSPKELVIERARITLPVLQTEMLPGRILYMELLDFSADVAQRIATTIGEALDEGELAGVVLDLRNNPGGYLNEAVDICDVFLPRGKVVVSTKSRLGADRTYRTRMPALIPEEVPLSVLINEYSASASEIVSGALSIHGRAVAVGARSFGKGSVQNIFPLESMPDEAFVDGNRNGQRDEWEEFTDRNGNGRHDYGPHVKLTVAYYYLPDGSSIHTQRDLEGRVVQAGGVAPDREIEFPELDFVTARELNRLLAEDPFRPFAQELFDQDRDLAVELAENDLHRIDRYPGFEDFYLGLDTKLERQEVRRWVRRSLRTIVSDARGKVFPGNGFYGDYVEDPQLREAIKVVLSASEMDYATLPEYAELIARAD